NSGGILFSLVNYDNVVAVQEFNLRLTPTGNVDSTFASQNLEPIFRVAPDDKIITSGNYSVVQRLLGDGNIDSAFAPTQVYFQANFQTITAFAFQPNGKVVDVGNGFFASGRLHGSPAKAGVVRLNANGGLDNTFVPPDFPTLSRFN